MGRIPPSKGKLLYHITHLNNMASILQYGLLSRKTLQEEGIIDFTDIADPCILNKRERYREALSKFVLFHFYAKNPFDGAVCEKYGPENMVIITIKRKLHEKNNFLIIPSHPLNSEEPDIFPYKEGLKYIKWDVLDMEMGRDYHNPEIKKACMAECVMEYRIPTEAFSLVFVYNNEVKQKIEALPNGRKIKLKVNSLMFP